MKNDIKGGKLMSLIEGLKNNGLIKISTNEESLKDALKNSLVCYTGFDPTADSLTLGHLVPITLLKKLKDAGHEIIILLGGATAKIGDPTGKIKSRPILTENQIQKNIEDQSKQIKSILGDVKVVNNFEWISQISLMEFLKEFAHFFSVNQMIRNEVYSSRIENQHHLSFSEFSYQLLQAYDWLHLYREYSCILQCAGSDQWANCLAGADIIKKIEGVDVHIICTSLLTTSDGKKMGKTEKGVIWLNPNKTSPFDFYQFILNLRDEDAFNLSKVLLGYNIETLDFLKEKHFIANKITEMVHGEEETKKVVNIIKNCIYDNNKNDENLPSIEINTEKEQLSVLEIFTLTKICESKNEVRNFIKNQGISINGEIIDDPTKSFNLKELNILRIGKNKIFKVKN